MSKEENPFRKAAAESAKKADEATAERVKKILSWTSIRDTLPPAEQTDLDALMKIVNDATTHNEKVAALIKNAAQLGGIAIKVLSKIP